MDIHLNRGHAYSPLFRSPRTVVPPARRQSPSRAMHLLRITWRILLLTLLLLFPSSALLAQEFGESVTRSGTVKEDIYLAGSAVNLTVSAEGDVIAAGGTLTIGDEIKGDVLLAGGSVTIRGKLRDDVRAAGGTVTLDAEVGDDALLAGGNVVLAPSTSVGGRAWLAGGRLDIAGRIGKELKAAGGNIVITAEVMGDVMLAGENIEIKPGAVIHGDLRYMSPNAAAIDKAARVEGTITHLLSPRHERGVAGAAAGIGILISLMVTGTVLLLLFPRIAAAVTDRIAQAPWKSLGLGLAVLAATPLVIILLFVSLIGLWLGFSLLAAYLVALLAGYLGGVLGAGEIVLKRLRRQPELSRGWRVAALVITLVVVGVLGLVPGLGGLVMFALLLFGLGGLSWQVYRAIAVN
jgi:cytoskeletal protein CcmA (bactofilin family)